MEDRSSALSVYVLERRPNVSDENNRIDKDGWKINVKILNARTEKEAKEKILLMQSKYGSMTGHSLRDFIVDADMDIQKVLNIISIPELDMNYLMKWGFDKEPGDETPINIIEDQNELK